MTNKKIARLRYIESSHAFMNLNRPILGRPIALHCGRPLNGPELFILLSCGGLFVLAPLGFGIWRANPIYSAYGLLPAFVESWTWFLICMLNLILLLVYFSYRLYLSRRYVAIHKNGIRLRLGLFHTRILQWSDISGISNDTVQEQFLHHPFRTVYRVKIFLNRGKSVLIRGTLSDMPGLSTRLKSYLYPRLSKSLQKSYLAGKWLTFGPLFVQRLGGIKIVNHHSFLKNEETNILSWDQLEQIDVSSGYLVFCSKRKQTIQIPVFEVPNLEILIQLIHLGEQA